MHIAGVSPLDSWDWTWGEGIEVVNAYTLRQNRHAETRAVALYNAAAFLLSSLGASFAGKDIQTFAEAFPGFDGVTQGKKDMSDDEMYAQVRHLNRMFGGEEET